MITVSREYSLKMQAMQTINHPNFDEGFRANMLDGGLPVVIDALRDIDTRASFDYNPSNWFPCLRVNPEFSDKTEDILLRGRTHLKKQCVIDFYLDISIIGGIPSIIAAVKVGSRGGWAYQHLADFIITQMK